MRLGNQQLSIQRIIVDEEQKVIDILLDSKAVRLDVYVNDDKGTVYNVEMQQGKQTNLAKRSRYYQGSIDLDKISKGKDYLTLNKSYVIFICTKDPFGKGRHKYTFRNVCIEDNSIELGDETDKVFLNTSGTLTDVDDEMMEFLSYVKNSTNEAACSAKSDLVKAINQKVNHVKHDKKMEVEYMTLLERDRLNFVEGKEEGREEGRKEGHQEGRIEEKIQMATKLLLRGMSIDEVASITELTREKVASLIE